MEIVTPWTKNTYMGDMLTVDSLTSQVLRQQWFLLWVWYSHSCRTISPTFTMGEIGTGGGENSSVPSLLLKGFQWETPRSSGLEWMDYSLHPRPLSPFLNLRKAVVACSCIFKVGNCPAVSGAGAKWLVGLLFTRRLTWIISSKKGGILRRQGRLHPSPCKKAKQLSFEEIEPEVGSSSWDEALKTSLLRNGVFLWCSIVKGS